jgi:hypothetical protein
VVIWRAICQSCERRRTSVQESWRVDQRATESKKGSWVGRRQKAGGRMQEDEGVGVERTVVGDK